MVILEITALSKMFDIIFEKYRKLHDDDKEKATIIEFKEDAFSYTELDDALTENRDFDKHNPNIIFENPYKKKCKVKQITITPNNAFKVGGMTEIYIGDEIFFVNKKSTNFSQIRELTIPLNSGISLKPNESVKIYLKSSTGKSMGLTAQVTFGE